MIFSFFGVVDFVLVADAVVIGVDDGVMINVESVIAVVRVFGGCTAEGFFFFVAAVNKSVFSLVGHQFCLAHFSISP